MCLIIYLYWISSSKAWYWAWVWAWYWARAWLNKWIKPNQAEFKLLYFITNSSLNIICRLVSISSQAWAFYFCCWAELEHSLLDKTRLVYSPNGRRLSPMWDWANSCGWDIGRSLPIPKRIIPDWELRWKITHTTVHPSLGQRFIR